MLLQVILNRPKLGKVAKYGCACDIVRFFNACYGQANDYGIHRIICSITYQMMNIFVNSWANSLRIFVINFRLLNIFVKPDSLFYITYNKNINIQHFKPTTSLVWILGKWMKVFQTRE
jgi:hypothetical protein